MIVGGRSVFFVVFVFFCGWVVGSRRTSVVAMFSQDNLYFLYIILAKNFYVHPICCALAGNLYFLDVSEETVHFLFVFMGIEGKMVGTERKEDITKERRKERNNRSNQRKKQRTKETKKELTK